LSPVAITGDGNVSKTCNLGKEKLQVTIEKVTETRTYFRGLGKVARHCRVTRGHLSAVLYGKRPAGRELAKKLAKIGVHVETWAGTKGGEE